MTDTYSGLGRRPGMSRRITLITPYFHPEVISCVPLMTSLTEDLVANGYEVEVLTSAPIQWDDGESVATHEGGVPKRDRFAGATVRRLRNPFPRRPGALSKLMEYVGFSIWACARVLFLHRADAIYVYSNPPLMGLVVAWIAHLRGVPVLYNLQDVFPDSAISGGLISPRSRAIRPLRRLERLTYATVDRVATISDDFAAHVRRVAPTADVEVIPNWIDTEAVRPITRADNRFLERSGIREEFVVLYSGNLGFLHGTDALLDAAKLLGDLPQVVFVIVGEGQQRQAMLGRARDAGLENVRFFDFQPFSMIADVYSAGDVCVVPMRRGASSSAIPSKTWSIMACGRPVIGAIDTGSELAGLIERVGAGVVVEPENGEALAGAIRALLADPAAREEMGARGRRYVESNLSRPSITRLYVDSLRALIDREPGSGKAAVGAGGRAASLEAGRVPSRPS